MSRVEFAENFRTAVVQALTIRLVHLAFQASNITQTLTRALEVRITVIQERGPC